MQVESPVYVFDPITSNLHLTQRLATQQVSDVDHFYDRYTHKHFILLLQDQHPAKIYWFAQEQLLEWQEFDPGFYGLASSSFSVLGMENIFAVGYSNDIELYADNSAGHYGVHHTVSGVCSSSNLLPTTAHVEDVILKRDELEERSYILAYQCIDDNSRVLKFRVLNAEKLDLDVSEDSTDELLLDMTALDEMISSQQPIIDQLQDIITTDAIMLRDADQVWTGPISFEDSFSVAGSLTVEELNLNIADLEVEGQSLDSLSQAIDELQAQVDELQLQSEDILYKHGDQFVAAPVSLNSLTAQSVLFENEPKFELLNSRSKEDYESLFLRGSSNQTVSTPFQFQSLTTDTVEFGSTGTVNNINIYDFLRTSVPNQIVLGHHTFENAIQLSHMQSSAPMTLNSHFLSDFVDRNSIDVHFTGSKQFTNGLLTDILNITYINGQNFNQWSESLIRTDSANLLTLTGDVIVKGDMIVSEKAHVPKVNGIDLLKLNNNIVYSSGVNQVIETPIIVEKHVIVRSNCDANTINDIVWDDVIDSFSPQVIYSKVFTDEASVSGKVICNDINSVNLNEDAVLNSPAQTIEGRVKFMHDLTVAGVDGITMDKKSRINGVDPSQLRALLGNVGQIVIRRPLTLHHPLNFSCPVTVDNLNGVEVDNLPNKFWRKSVDQIIPVDVSIKELNAMRGLTVKTLNALPLEEYFIQGLSQTIKGRYHFKGGIDVEKDISLGPNITVDRVDVENLVDSVISLHSDQIIFSEQNFLGGLVVENLYASENKVNNVSLDDLVSLKDPNTMSGHIKFRGTVSSSDILAFSDFQTQKMNGKLLEKEFDNMVKFDEDATVRGSILFEEPVEINHFKVNNKIDGIDLEDFDQKTLKKFSETLQKVSGQITVEGDLDIKGNAELEILNNGLYSSIADGVVLQNYTGKIHGEKIFQQPVYVIDKADVRVFNGLDVNETIENILTKNTDQNIPAAHRFTNVISNNTIVERMNNFPLNMLIYLDEPCSSIKTVHFMDLANIKHLLTPNDFLGSCDVNTLLHLRDWRNFDDTNISDALTVAELKVTGNIQSYPFDIKMQSDVPGKDKDFTEFMESFVTKSDNHFITGKVRFSGRNFIASLNTSFVNSVDMDEVQNNSVRNSDRNINCRLEFEEPLICNELVIENNISYPPTGVKFDEVSVSDLGRTAVRRSQLPYTKIRGTKTFTSGLNVGGNVDFDRWNGELAQNFVLVTNKSTVTADVEFTELLDVGGNLEVRISFSWVST